MEKKQSNRCVMAPSPNGVCRLGIYVNSGSGNLFYSSVGQDTATNRIIPKSVWLDKDGCICVHIDRREKVFFHDKAQHKATVG